MKRRVFLMQLVSMLGIWVLLAGVILWLSNSIRLAIELDDAPNATIIITIIAMIVFAVLVGVLTYVFIGLQQGRGKSRPRLEGDGPCQES